MAILEILKHGHACPIADQHYAQAAAEIERYRTALTHFADPANWHEAPGCQQWMGKLDARSFANSVLNHLPRDDE